VSSGIFIPEELVDKLQVAKSVAVLTGAGISAESGIPTFREAQTGLWAQYNPEELATPRAFQRDPHLVWDWYQWRRGLISNANPNPGHIALRDMEIYLEKQGKQFTLITQNVDDLHQRAGSKNILALHGKILQEKCFECAKTHQGSFQRTPKNPEIPRCQSCGGMLRPDVVWFGEGLPPDTIRHAWVAAENCDVFFSIGTSALVQPAASLPIIAIQNGAFLVEINPTKTPLTSQTALSLQGPAGQILPELISQVTTRKGE